LEKLGIKAQSPNATFYVWFEVPSGYTSSSFAGLLLDKAGIMATPGNGFGEPGEGYVRMALTVSKERLAEAVDRMNAMGF
jgi:LL-diaminopimelate aminotransferase